MRIPLIVHLGAAAQVAPLVAAALARRPVRGARAWMLVWCGVLVVFDGASLLMATRDVHNLWLSYVQTAVGGAIALWALSMWQRHDVARLGLRLAVVPFLVLWGVLTLVVEDTSAFSRAADPMASIVGLSAAAFTLLSRSFSGTGSLLRSDWFWVSAGMAMYFGTSSALGPLSALLVGESAHLLDLAYQIKALLDVCAFLLIARGVTCPTAT